MGAIIHNGIIYGGSTPINDASQANKTTYSSNKIESRLAETQSIIGESYDATKSYTVGERFIDGNIIYTVKVACQGVTPPNSTYYIGRRVVDEISALNSDIATLNSKLAFPSFQYKGIMGNGILSHDFNDYTTPGTYVNGGTNSGFTHTPHSADNGYLIVITPTFILTASGYVHQFWISEYRGYNKYRKRDIDGSWSNWIDIFTT